MMQEAETEKHRPLFYSTCWCLSVCGNPCLINQVGVLFLSILRNDLSGVRQTRKQVGVFHLKCFGPDFLLIFPISTVRNWPVHSVAACDACMCVSV